MNRRQFRTTVLVGLLAAGTAIGTSMFNAVAHDRPHDPFTQGALPPAQVPPPPTAIPAAVPGSALRTIQTERFDTTPNGWSALSMAAMPDQQGGWASAAGTLVAKAPDSGQQSFEDSYSWHRSPPQSALRSGCRSTHRAIR